MRSQDYQVLIEFLLCLALGLQGRSVLVFRLGLGLMMSCGDRLAWCYWLAGYVLACVVIGWLKGLAFTGWRWKGWLVDRLAFN